MITVRFTNIGPHRHSWLSNIDHWDGELLIIEIKRRRFCADCGESYAGRTVCELCDAELVDAWPYRTPPDIWYDGDHGKVWRGGQEALGVFEVVTEEAE
jgi:hypothetical protein